MQLHLGLQSNGTLLLLPILACLLSFGCGEPPIDTDEVRQTIVRYMMARAHGGAPFEEQLYPDVNPAMYDPRDSSLYFALAPEDCTSDDRRDSRMNRYVLSTDDLEWSKTNGERFSVGEMRARTTEDFACACRTNIANLAIDTGMVLTFSYDRADFKITPASLARGLRNESVYGGPLRVNEGRRTKARYDFYNHGAMVSTPEDRPLAAFVSEILAEVSSDRESRIQALLDFVTEEITYDNWEARGKREILKRASEVLISGRSDCSNKTILFASMLEQIGEDYVLVYSPRHISVAIPKGGFASTNGHDFPWKGTTWVACETTNPSFKIGITKLVDYHEFDDITYVQRPSAERGMVDPRNGNVVGGM